MGTGFFPSETIVDIWTLAEFDTLVLPGKKDPMSPETALVPPATSIVAWHLLKPTVPKSASGRILFPLDGASAIHSTDVRLAGVLGVNVVL
jgi:hypothetical protein